MLRSSKEVERTINDITFSNEIDLASSLEGREMAFQLSSRERNELRMVEEALFKIKGDTYGVCDSCSKYITLKRLGDHAFNRSLYCMPGESRSRLTCPTIFHDIFYTSSRFHRDKGRFVQLCLHPA